MRGLLHRAYHQPISTNALRHAIEHDHGRAAFEPDLTHESLLTHHGDRHTALRRAPGVAFAGMPMVTLTDLAHMRLQTISFFLLLFVVCSWVVRLIWNAAQNDFSWLPYLTFRRAMGLVACGGCCSFSSSP